MNPDRDTTYSNAAPRGDVLTATIIEPIVSGVTQRTEHEIACVFTFTDAAGANMRDIGNG